MPISRSEDRQSKLTTTREPVGVQRPGTAKTIGEFAINDALLVVGAAWLALILFYISVRHVNV